MVWGSNLQSYVGSYWQKFSKHVELPKPNIFVISGKIVKDKVWMILCLNDSFQ